MPITAYQKQQRKRYLGSSDMAAILTVTDTNGDVVRLDPFKNEYDVWLSKTHELEDIDSQAAKRGNYFERGCVAMARDMLGGVAGIHNQWRVNHDLTVEGHKVFASQIDFHIPSINAGIEAKTTAIYQDWGTCAEDEVPYRVIVQTHQQMICFGYWKVYVVVDLPNVVGYKDGQPIVTNDTRLYTIERDEKLIDQLITYGLAWWKVHIIDGIPPREQQPTKIATVKHIIRTTGKKVALNSALVDEWLAAQKAQAAAKKEYDLKLAAVLVALDDAEIGVTSDGREFWYVTEKGGMRVNTKLLKTEYPDVYADVTNSITRRVARVKTVHKEQYHDDKNYSSGTGATENTAPDIRR